MYKISKCISEIEPLSILSEVTQVSKGLHYETKLVVTGYFCVYAMLQPWLQVLFLMWSEILTLIHLCNMYFEFLSIV